MNKEPKIFMKQALITLEEKKSPYLKHNFVVS